MLPDVEGGNLIRKRVHDPPKLTDIDPNFGEEYDEAKHGKILREEFRIAHLTEFQQSVIPAVIKKYWRIFSKKGITTPVKPLKGKIDI